MGIVDFKTKQLAAKVYTGKKSKPHPGQGSSWYNKKLKKQLNATNSMNFGSVVIWDSPGWKVVKKVKHAEPENHGKWTMISEWTTGRIGIYESETGKFVKYIYNLTTPTFTYSVEHRQHIPGA